jgi:CTD kinase subunit beta
MKRTTTTLKQLIGIVPREVAKQAWKLGLDGYRTFAPLKYPPHILALAYIHLSYLLTSTSSLIIPYGAFAARQCDVDAVMIDLLDLYIHHLATTHIGPQYPLQRFMTLQIGIRRGLTEEEEDGVGIPAMRDASAGDRGTVRFILDWDRVIREQEILEGIER